MTADPRTLAANLELFVNYYGTDPGVPMSAVDEAAAGAAFIRSMVPLHDAWLKANPPCPTCGGKWRVLCTLPRMHEGPCDAPEPHRDGQWLCPDCPDGVSPFDKWTTGLVAENGSLSIELAAARGGLYAATQEITRLRQIRGAR